MKKILRQLISYLFRPICKILTQDALIELKGAMNEIENKAIANRRFYAIMQATEYLLGAKIDGDYLEFGVFEGSTFRFAYKNLSPYFDEMKFYAFDSFEGLPEPRGIDNIKGYSSNFNKGDFFCTEQKFKKLLESDGVEMKKISIIKGWFDDTLRNKKENYGVRSISLAYIDSDFYESTVPVLEFITPRLEEGSLIIFDDWRCYRNQPHLGVQKACNEWLERNPHIKLRELFSYGWNGIAFTVSAC